MRLQRQGWDLMHMVELSRLEGQIDLVLEAYERMKSENQQLRQQLAASVQERAALKNKNQELAAQVRDIISRIKEDMP
jgi:uncharacterized protein (TIGR02449 family)